jgi:hypothetical protein
LESFRYLQPFFANCLFGGFFHLLRKVSNLKVPKTDEPTGVSTTTIGSTTKPVQTNSSTQPATSAQYDESRMKFEAEQAEYNECNNANHVAGQKYSAAINRAKVAYDEIMNLWEAAKNQPVHNPYSE